MDNCSPNSSRITSGTWHKPCELHRCGDVLHHRQNRTAAIATVDSEAAVCETMSTDPSQPCPRTGPEVTEDNPEPHKVSTGSALPPSPRHMPDHPIHTLGSGPFAFPRTTARGKRERVVGSMSPGVPERGGGEDCPPPTHLFANLGTDPKVPEIGPEDTGACPWIPGTRVPRNWPQGPWDRRRGPRDRSGIPGAGLRLPFTDP
jgi:hypothetical protein